MIVGKVVACLCLTLIIKELKFSVEHDRVVTTLNTINNIIFRVVLPTIHQRCESICFTIFKESPFKVSESLGNITNRNWTHVLITPQEIDTPTYLRGFPPPPPVRFLFTTWPRKLSITRVTWFRFPPPPTLLLHPVRRPIPDPTVHTPSSYS
jgi:hypothetical protein